ncbi:helicase HerA-like domain-containing protein, partial [Turicimonas muris]
MEPGLANRHGCISGATGTGKTVSLQKLAEDFSRVGVPVFLADIKGDLSGLAKAAVPSEKLKERIIKKKLQEPEWKGCPVTF